VIGPFEPVDLMLLRFGVGTLLFLPYLALHFRSIRRDAWRRGVPLALFQGAGMAALVICGLQYAPASHAAALGPGIAPAWVALLGFLVFAKTVITHYIDTTAKLRILWLKNRICLSISTSPSILKFIAHEKSPFVSRP
jgi:drug/metabolite transporter (DMT)-like permease